MKKILVTGGAGYIGSHTVKELLLNGEYEVTIVDNLSTSSENSVHTLKTISDRVVFKRGDLGNEAFMRSLFESQDFYAVIHFAASIVVPESIEKPLKYYANNTSNTTSLLKLCDEFGVERFIFSSTAAVYGQPKMAVDSMLKVGITEETEPKPINPYGRSKLFSEEILKDFADAAGIRFVILRYFNVAGADMNGAKSVDEIDPRLGQSFPNATHLIKVAAEAAVGKRDYVKIFGTDYPTPDGTGVRDYIHVDDLALAHLEALEYIDSKGSEIFNCGYGHGYSVREVLQTMKRVSKKDFKVIEAPRRDGDPAALVANNEKILSSTSWKPRFDDLELICKSALEWEKKSQE